MADSNYVYMNSLDENFALYRVNIDDQESENDILVTVSRKKYMEMGQPPVIQIVTNSAVA